MDEKRKKIKREEEGEKKERINIFKMEKGERKKKNTLEKLAREKKKCVGIFPMVERESEGMRKEGGFPMLFIAHPRDDVDVCFVKTRSGAEATTRVSSAQGYPTEPQSLASARPGCALVKG